MPLGVVPVRLDESEEAFDSVFLDLEVIWGWRSANTIYDLLTGPHSGTLTWKREFMVTIFNDCRTIQFCEC